MWQTSTRLKLLSLQWKWIFYHFHFLPFSYGTLKRLNRICSQMYIFEQTQLGIFNQLTIIKNPLTRITRRFWYLNSICEDLMGEVHTYHRNRSLYLCLCPYLFLSPSLAGNLWRHLCLLGSHGAGQWASDRGHARTPRLRVVICNKILC